MNDQELERLLKSAKTPEPPEQYWRELPKRVTAKLHWQAQARNKGASSSGRRFTPRSLWAAGAAAACVCVVIGLTVEIQHHSHSLAPSAGDNQFAEARKCFQELEALFPNQLQAIVFDQQGPRFVLAPEADVPAAAPLYLKICGPKGCEDVVTFSGQQIRFNGENCEVLANADGQVMLVGSHEVWTGDHPAAGVRVESRML